jgi:hypothetical protein
MIRIKGMRLLAGFALGLLSSLGVAHAGQAVEGSAKADKLEACVRDTPFMRRSHFELIKHQRDVTVHQGIRKTTDSLAGCVDCHVRRDAQGEPVAINAPGEFCAACHAYTAVTIDCFTCHATVPTEQSAALLPEVEAKLGSMDPAMLEKVHAAVPAMTAAESGQATGN